MMKRITRFLFLLLLAASVALPAAVSAEVKTIESDPRIARLEVVYSCGCTKSCSGTMISKIGMITPSGSLYCTEHGKLFSSVVFYFGWQGNSNAFYVYDGPFEYHAYETFEYGYECTQQLLNENPDLDAVIASVDVQGLGAIRALSERGMRVPEQVRVMSLTGHEVGGMLETSMTSMEMPAHEMGAKAARMIIDEIETPEGKKHAAQHLSFAVSLAEREST